MANLTPLNFNFTGLPARTVASPGCPYVDVKASALYHLASNYRAMVGMRALVDDRAMVIDSASDLGDGYWRLRLTDDWPEQDVVLG